MVLGGGVGVTGVEVESSGVVVVLGVTDGGRVSEVESEVEEDVEEDSEDDVEDEEIAVGERCQG